MVIKTDIKKKNCHRGCDRHYRPGPFICVRFNESFQLLNSTLTHLLKLLNPVTAGFNGSTVLSLGLLLHQLCSALKLFYFFKALKRENLRFITFAPHKSCTKNSFLIFSENTEILISR